MLTKKQYELLNYIHQYLKEHGISPSFDEMKSALNLKSKSGIHRLITGLEEREFIRRLPHRARALQVVRLPDNTRPEPVRPVRDGAKPLPARLVTANFPRSRNSAGGKRPKAGESVHLPLLGRIAAGTPIEALRDNSGGFDCPANLLSRGEHYALQVAGDSMVDAGIHDGDTVVIERSDSADSGAIVVALIDDQEVTLKRLRRKGNSVALEAANPAYETRIFPPQRVKIQGRLVALVRQY